VSLPAHIAADPEFEASTIRRVDDHMGDEAPGFLVATDMGCLHVANPDRLPLPKAGDTVRFYGRGLGYPVRGVVVGDTVYRYRTEEEEQEAHARAVAERKAAKEREWHNNAHETAARVAALPEPFRVRFEFFLRRPEWGPAFGPYELFVCEEATKIAGACADSEDVARFYDDRERQQGVIADGHSGNTFGAACRLAALYLARPDYVPRMHGALCPLVGCDEYGCWATTEEAKRGREAGT
jgi:hypothetical protein